MALKFEWDEKKSRANIRKHRVSFEESMTVFGDPFARINADENKKGNSIGEKTL